MTLASQLPAKRLSNHFVQDLLTAALVTPEINTVNKVTAFRLSWLKCNEESVRHIWSNILQWRCMFDNVVRKAHGIRYFISAITGTQSTFSQKGQAPRYSMNPGLGYWILSDGSFEENALSNQLHGNPYGACLKGLSSVKGQARSEVIGHSLFTVLKDNVDGAVRRMVLENAPNDWDGTLAKFIVVAEEERDKMEQVSQGLLQQNFLVSVE